MSSVESNPLKSPALPLGLLYAGGVLVGQGFDLAPFWLLAASAITAAWAFSSTRFGVVLCPILLLVAGWTNYTVRTAVLSPHDLRTKLGDTAEYVTVRGSLLETPVVRMSSRNGQPVVRSQAGIRVTAIRRDTGESEPAFGRVLATVPGLLGDDCFAGQEVEVTGVLARPRRADVEGLFDYRVYLESLGIYYQLRTESTNDWVVLNPKKRPPLTDQFRRWAEGMLARGLGEPDLAVELIWAMTLGRKTALTGEIADAFVRSGTLHIFAISGLHIALIAGILLNLLRAIQIPRRLCGVFIVPLLWFYTAATGWQPSAIRSTIMMSIVVAGWSLERPPNLLNSLAAAGLVILVWDPRQLFQAGFQLSFVVVLGMALLVPRLENWRVRLLKPDPLLPEELRPRWHQWLDAGSRWIVLSLGVSVAAWLASLPLIAHYFYLVAPVGLLSNLIVVPLSSLALASTLASLLCGAWWPALSEIFNHSSWFLMVLMVRASQWAAELPGAYLYVRPLPLWGMALYYLVLIGASSGWIFAKRRRIWTAAGTLLWFGLACVAFASRAHEVTVLPASGGILHIDSPGRADDLLIGTGNASTAQYLTIPFLRSRGINRLEKLLLTHGDVNHMGGIGLIRSNFAAVRIVTSPAPSRSAGYRSLLSELESSPEQWVRVTRGDRLGPWTVLHPGSGEAFPRGDDNVIVLQGDLFGLRILLLSELDRAGQRKLVERESAGELVLRSDIVVAGMPAQGEPLRRELLERIDPRLIILVCGEYPPSARVRPALRDRLERTGIPILYTSEAGVVNLRFTEAGCRIRTRWGDKFVLR